MKSQKLTPGWFRPPIYHDLRKRGSDKANIDETLGQKVLFVLATAMSLYTHVPEIKTRKRRGFL